MSTRLEDEVREALWTSTERLSTPSDAYSRVMGAVAEGRRRRRAVVLRCALAALVLFGVVGLSTGILDAGQRDSTPATDRIIDGEPDWGPASDWPARGELATDARFAEEFARLYGTDHRLLYAEDGDAGRVVIALSATRHAVVFLGERESELAALQRIPGATVDRDVAVAVPHEEGHLIIMVMPERVSAAELGLPTVGRDGSIGRTWQQVPGTQGVARVVVEGPLGVVRVRPLDWLETPLQVIVGGELPGTLACSPCDGEWFARDGVAQFRHLAADVVRADIAEVSARVLFDVAVGDRRAVALVAALPSGGLLRATYLVAPGAGSGETTVAELLRPLPAGDESRPVVFPGARVDGSAAQSVVLAPGSSRIAFTPVRGGAPLEEVTLTDGVAIVDVQPEALREYRLTEYDFGGSVGRTWHGGSLYWADPWHTEPFWTAQGD